MSGTIEGPSKFKQGSLREWSNGKGQVQDWCEVAQSVVVGESCAIKGHAEVRGMVDLHDRSIIAGEAQVFDNVHLTRSNIGDGAFVGGDVWMIDSGITGEARVSGRVRMFGSHVMGHAVVNGSSVTLKHALVTDKARVYDIATVEGAQVRQEAVICGTARVEGDFVIDKAMRIHEGVWTRPPKFIDGGIVQMTECINGNLIIGCQCHPLKWWWKHAYAMGRLYNWSAVEVSRFIDLSREFE